MREALKRVQNRGAFLFLSRLCVCARARARVRVRARACVYANAMLTR